MADRVGVIDKGKLLLTEKTSTLLKDLGTKQVVF